MGAVGGTMMMLSGGMMGLGGMHMEVGQRLGLGLEDPYQDPSLPFMGGCDDDAVGQGDSSDSLAHFMDNLNL